MFGGRRRFGGLQVTSARTNAHSTHTGGITSTTASLSNKVSQHSPTGTSDDTIAKDKDTELRDSKDPYRGKNYNSTSDSSRDKDYSSSRDKDYNSSRDKDYNSSRDKDYNSSRDKDYNSSRDKDYNSSRDKDYNSSRDKDYNSSRDKDYNSSRDKDYNSSR
eukprot:Lankesteria_metandrocarpae@DN10244_c0_g1_i1.p1